MSTPISEDKMAGIKAALFEGQKIQAIKLYRKATNVGLAEAKNAVEKLEAELRAVEPGKFTAAASGKGCLGLMVMICICVGVFVFWLARK